MMTTDTMKALANERRLMILHWLKDPRAHFKPQVDGDLVKDGVCALLLAEKLGITQATLSEHMRVLVKAGQHVAKGQLLRHGTVYFYSMEFVVYTRREDGRVRPGTMITGSPPRSQATVIGLTNGAVYTFTVVASSADGTSAASDASNPVVPGAGRYHPLSPVRILDTRPAPLCDT